MGKAANKLSRPRRACARALTRGAVDLRKTWRKSVERQLVLLHVDSFGTMCEFRTLDAGG